MAENDVGKGPVSDPLLFNTSEEEPSSPPVDVSVEPKGTSTIRIAWKPPSESEWNGRLIGFYVGFKARGSSNELPYSYKTVDAITTKDNQNQQLKHEIFITNLLRNTEYNVIVKCYNSAGSGPPSHEMWVRTLDGNLPMSPKLYVIRSLDSLTLRWMDRDNDMEKNSITGYVIYYIKEGESKWKEIEVPNQLRGLSGASRSDYLNSNTHILKNLKQDSNYKFYVSAVNIYGIGDPSNVVISTIESGEYI